MAACLIAHVDGRLERVRWNQRDIATLLRTSLTEAHGDLAQGVTFVGAVDALSVVAVALRDATHLPVNSVAETCPAEVFMEEMLPVRGPVAFVASDARGKEADVKADALIAWLRSTAR